MTLPTSCQTDVMHVFKHILGFAWELFEINGHENCECSCPGVYVVDRLKVLFFDDKLTIFNHEFPCNVRVRP